MPRQNTKAMKAKEANDGQLQSISDLTRPRQTPPIVKDPKISKKNCYKLQRTAKMAVRRKLK